MICFEILKNGKRMCLAGGEDLSMLNSTVTWAQRPSKQEGGTEETILNLSAIGTTNELQSHRWLGEELIAVGDEITIRVVESSVADIPTIGKSISSDFRDEIKAYVERFKELYSS